MNEEELFYLEVGKSIKGSEQSQMFGKPCFKINGKAFVSFFQNEMVFKLRDPEHAEAMQLEGVILFDPSGKGRAMKEWVQIPYKYKDRWKYFAESSRNYVA